MPETQNIGCLSGSSVDKLSYPVVGAGPWANADLTSATRAPSVSLNGDITSWLDQTFQHVAYLDSAYQFHARARGYQKPSGLCAAND